MNTRIQELKQQSYVTKRGEVCFDDGDVEIIDVNKFAELIIAECVIALWTTENNTSDLAIEEYKRAKNKIAEHFGVKT